MPVAARFTGMTFHRLVAIGLALPALAGAQSSAASSQRVQEFAIDAGHTIVEFSIRFAFSHIKGRFTNTNGTILYNASDPSRSSITVVIDSKSLDTGWGHRDEHRSTSDFFNVEKYPRIVFQSDRMVRQGNGWRAEGKLTMHGVTKAISIPFHLLQAPARGTEGTSLIVNAEGGLKLARADFGINGGSTFNPWFTKARAATMGDSVDISIDLEGWVADIQGQLGQVQTSVDRISTSGVQAQIERYANFKRTSPDPAPGIVNGGDFTTRALISAGKNQEAVTLSKAVAEMFPAEPRVHMVYGAALAAAGDNASALREYSRARDVFKPIPPDPNEKFPQVDDNWYYMDQLARDLVELNKASIAVPVAKVTAEMFPNFAKAHSMLGIALAAAGDKRGAMAAYARALELDPGETRALEYQRH